jgi:Xaa-Pro aminopeptidase
MRASAPADARGAQPFDPWRAVPREEFLARQDRAREAARAAGLAGLVVYSRGGAFPDMCADVLYLTNHYSQQPYVADHVGIGNARSHGVVVLPVEGPTILVVDIPWWRPDLVVADEVRPSIDVTGRVGQALRDGGLLGRRVGLVGASSMTASAYLGLRAVAGDTVLVRADDLVERLRMVKSPAELEVIRRAAAVGNRTVEAIMEAAVEGATEAEAAAAGAAVIAASGAAPYDMACASGPWAHQFTWARLPSHDATRRLRPGDLFHVDCYGAYGGYLWDFGRTRVVGAEPTDAQRDLLEATVEGVEATCRAIRPGATASEVYAAAARWLEESPAVQALPPARPEMEEFPAVGHGLGMSWEGPWLMEGDRTPIEPGMYLAVELLLGHGSVGGVMFEQNGLVTEVGFEVLTTVRARWW